MTSEDACNDNDTHMLATDPACHAHTGCTKRSVSAGVSAVDGETPQVESITPGHEKTKVTTSSGVSARVLKGVTPSGPTSCRPLQVTVSQCLDVSWHCHKRLLNCHKKCQDACSGVSPCLLKFPGTSHHREQCCDAPGTMTTSWCPPSRPPRLL